jgi:tRNA/rRNA methyltransferase
MSLESMSRVRIVLVRPLIAGNIGSVARLMENFAAGGLYLVDPVAKPLSRESLERSTHGEHRLHEARVVGTVAEALEGTIYAIGASRRRGPTHQAGELSPRDMASLVRDRVAEGGVALLLGPEDNGLSREDLLACDQVVRIPAQPDYPTLNLSHAAAICLYEVFAAIVSEKALDIPPSRRRTEPADAAMMARLIEKLQHALLTIGYLRPEKPDHLMFPIRSILSRAELTRAEAQILMGLAQQIDEFAKYH